MKREGPNVAPSGGACGEMFCGTEINETAFAEERKCGVMVR